jgi:hypothetical protein
VSRRILWLKACERSCCTRQRGLFATIQGKSQRNTGCGRVPRLRNDDCSIRRKVSKIFRLVALMRLDGYLPLRPFGPAPVHVLVSIAFGLVAVALHEILLPILIALDISLLFEEFALIGGPNEPASIQCLQ